MQRRKKRTFLSEIFDNIKIFLGGVFIASAVIYFAFTIVKEQFATLYIDNDSFQNLNIYFENEKWMSVPATSTEKSEFVKEGEYVFVIKSDNGKNLDTVSLSLEKNHKYVLNLLGLTSYIRGQVTYYSPKLRDVFNSSDTYETEHNSIFFELTEDYIFESPKQGISAPKDVGIIKKTYIRRVKDTKRKQIMKEELRKTSDTLFENIK